MPNIQINHHEAHTPATLRRTLRANDGGSINVAEAGALFTAGIRWTA